MCACDGAVVALAGESLLQVAATARLISASARNVDERRCHRSAICAASTCRRRRRRCRRPLVSPQKRWRLVRARARRTMRRDKRRHLLSRCRLQGSLSSPLRSRSALSQPPPPLPPSPHFAAIKLRQQQKQQPFARSRSNVRARRLLRLTRCRTQL